MLLPGLTFIKQIIALKEQMEPCHDSILFFVSKKDRFNLGLLTFKFQAKMTTIYRLRVF